MKSTHAPASRMRPLAACLIALNACATATPLDIQAAPSSPSERKTIVVENCNDSGAGSLRGAILQAASDDSIDLTQLNCSRISLTTGALHLAQDNLKLVGPGQNDLVIDGLKLDSIIDHTGFGTLRVSGMSLVNGNRRSIDAAKGGCISSVNNLRLENVSVSQCKVTSSDNSALGGAVWVSGYAAIVHSTISQSIASADLASGNAAGGGLYVGVNLYMRASSVFNNVVVASETTGGGFVVGNVANISESLVAGNVASNAGGAWIGGRATIVNSTVSGNTAVIVGGIWAVSPMNLYNSTVAFNNSSYWFQSNGHYFPAGVYAHGGVFSSNIISKNANSAAPYDTSDFLSTVAVSGESNNVMFCESLCPVDTTHEDPGLSPLRDNGGPTKTHAPTPGVWDRLEGVNRRGAIWDQRGVGFPRVPPGERIEIGAFQTNSGIVFVNGFN